MKNPKTLLNEVDNNALCLLAIADNDEKTIVREFLHTKGFNKFIPIF